MKCPSCSDDYPDDLFAPVYVDGRTVVCCPLCAVEAIRTAHGDPEYVPKGPLAKAVYRASRIKDRRLRRTKS